jgi:hypothetical protein
LVFGWGAARAADPQDAGGFRMVLVDGSTVKGAASLVINLDTAYGQIKITSSSLVSAQFDVDQKWADIRLNDAQLKLRYNPASSDLKATTAAGSLTIPLAKVIKVAKGAVQVPSEPLPQTASQDTAQPQPGAPPPSAPYAQQPPPSAPYVQQPPPATVPPSVVYQYPYQYQYPYVAPAPYYYSPYYYSPYYYGWPGPYFGVGIGVGRGFGRFYGGFPGIIGFGVRIR